MKLQNVIVIQVDPELSSSAAQDWVDGWRRDNEAAQADQSTFFLFAQRQMHVQLGIKEPRLLQISLDCGDMGIGNWEADGLRDIASEIEDFYENVLVKVSFDVYPARRY